MRRASKGDTASICSRRPPAAGASRPPARRPSGSSCRSRPDPKRRAIGADNLLPMANWRSPGRAERLVIYEEDGQLCQYWRAEDAEGNVLWRKESPDAGKQGEEMTT